MANYTPKFSAHKTLVAATEDTITWDGGSPGQVEVVNRSATDTIYVRTDSTAAVAEADGTTAIPPGQAVELDGSPVTRLISAGTPAYSVERLR